MDNSNSNKYISLKTAARSYGYTRDHLGLMIRQGKLKGTKLGSYYVTTGEWMADYIKNFSNPEHPASRNKFSNRFLTDILSSNAGSPRSVFSKPKKQAASAVSNERQKNIIESPIGGSGLEDMILEELAQYQLLADKKPLNTGVDTETIQTGGSVISYSGAPFVILPVRRMEDEEREAVLRKVEFD